MNWDLTDYQRMLLFSALTPFLFCLWSIFEIHMARRKKKSTIASELSILFAGITAGILISIGLGYIPIMYGVVTNAMGHGPPPSWRIP